MRSYLNINVGKVSIYGFMSGMSLLLSGNTLNFWLASFGINPKVIGFFSLIALPYALKYFIAIFINHFHIKKPQYKIWLMVSQIMICLLLIIMSFLELKNDLWLVAIIGFFIALFSVIQDIILSANRINILKKNILVQGTAMHSVGYRFGMLFSGAGVIFASIYINWSNVFLVLAVFYMFLTIFVNYFYQEESSVHVDVLKEKGSVWNNIFTKPFKDFFPYKRVIWLLLFILFYRMADHMLMVMVNPFFLDIGYTAAEIARIYKFFGTVMVITGGLISSFIIVKLGTKKSLLYFSIIHMLGSLFYIILSLIGKNISLLYVITGYEALTGGMMMTVYISYISSICKGKYTASQYALFMSAMGLSRVLFPVPSGLIMDYLGNTGFFIVISSVSFLTVLFTAFVIKTKRISV